MASTPKDSERLELRLERRILIPLKDEAKRLKLANVQAHIARICEKHVENTQISPVAVTALSSDIDLRKLLIEALAANAEANRTIARQAETIHALTRGHPGEGQTKRHTA